MTTIEPVYIGIDDDGKVIVDGHGVPMVMIRDRWDEYDFDDLAEMPARMATAGLVWDPNTAEYKQVT